MSAHYDFNSLVRQASGRAQPFERRDPPTSLHDGHLGVGKGGVALPLRRPDNDAINDQLRRAMRLARQVAVPGGVNLGTVDLTDLYGDGR